jgi:hypothetical protein
MSHAGDVSLFNLDVCLDTTRTKTTQPKVVPRFSKVGPSHAEDLCHNGELEDRGAGGYDEGDDVHGKNLAASGVMVAFALVPRRADSCDVYRSSER